MRSWVALFAAAVLVAWAISEVVPVDRSNPPQRYRGVILSPALDRQLAASCFDCHSNRTRWPWYSTLSPVKFWLAHDVSAGRKELNFDRWGEMTERQKAKKRRESAHELSDGEMPPGIYLRLHPEARISAADRRALIRAFEASPSAEIAPGPKGVAPPPVSLLKG